MTGDPIAEAAAATRRGELIVLPTDTVYGIGTRPDDRAATARLFAAKQRPRGLTLPVLVASGGEARRLARFDERADRLAAACWPGALTIVLERSPESAEWDLGSDTTTIGLRVPRHPLALAVLAAAGPLAVTSANRSGHPPAATCEELEAVFGDLIGIYLCQDEPLRGEPSAVVDLSGEGVRVLRPGAWSPEALAALSAGEGPLLDSRPSP